MRLFLPTKSLILIKFVTSTGFIPALEVPAYSYNKVGRDGAGNAIGP